MAFPGTRRHGWYHADVLSSSKFAQFRQPFGSRSPVEGRNYPPSCKRTVSGSNPLTGSTTTPAIMPSLPAVTHLIVALVVVAIRGASPRLVTADDRSLLHVGCTAGPESIVLTEPKERTTPVRLLVGEVLSSVAVGHPEGTRSALDRFSETSTVDLRVRGDVPPHPLPSGERLFLIFAR
jgi:hypothetical protein